MWQRRLLALGLLLVLLALGQRAPAQFSNFPPGVFLGHGARDASGGGVSIAALVGANNGAGGVLSPDTIVSGQSFSAGVVACGFVSGVGAASPTGMSMNGVNASQIGSTVTDGSFTNVEMWQAVVTAGTGNIVVSNGGTLGAVAISCWTISGYSSSTPTANATFNGLSSTQNDPQGPLGSLTVSSGGVAAIFIGATFQSGGANPTSWVQATRDSLVENGTALGNGIASAGAHISSSGTYTGITATGAGGAGGSGATSWQYSGMFGAAWH